MTKVSIIVPAYNIQKYIFKCLKSIQAQSFKDFECIVVNDGSTDFTLPIIKFFIRKDNRFKLLNQKNGGLSNARNNALRMASGEYILFVDGDDYIEPELLELTLRRYEETNADLVAFPFYNFGTDHYIFSFYDIDLQKTYSLIEDPQLLFSINPSAWNKLWKKSYFIDNQIYFPEGKYFEDFCTTFKILPLTNAIAFVEKPLYHYRLSTNSITSHFSNKLNDVLFVTKDLVNFYKEKCFFQTYYEEFKQLVFSNYHYWKHRIQENNIDNCETFIDEFRQYLISIWPEYPACKYNK